MPNKTRTGENFWNAFLVGALILGIIITADYLCFDLIIGQIKKTNLSAVKEVIASIAKSNNDMILSVLNKDTKVTGILKIRVEIESLKTNLRTMLNPQITTEELRQQIKNIAKGRKNYKKSLEVYEQMNKSPSQEALWKEFKMLLGEWEKENDRSLELADKLADTNLHDAGYLKGKIEQFKGDHYYLIALTGAMLQNKEIFESGDDAEQCEFTRWYANYGGMYPNISVAAMRMYESHAKFHDTIRNIKHLVKSGDTGKASLMLTNELIPLQRLFFSFFNVMSNEAEKSSDLLNELNAQIMVKSRDKEMAASDALEKLTNISIANAQTSSKAAAK